MDTTELVFTLCLAVVLLGLGGFYSWRQIRLLRRLRAGLAVSPLERQYLHRQAWRRLVCSGLMLLLAGLLFTPLLFQDQLTDLRERHARAPAAVQAPDKNPPPTPEQVQLLEFYSGYALALLIIFLLLLCFAVFDLLATRRFTVRQLQEMTEQHQQILKEQGARLREERRRFF